MFIVEFKFGIGDKVKTLSQQEGGFVSSAAVTGGSEVPEYLVTDGAEEPRWFSEDQLQAVEKSGAKGDRYETT